MILITRMNSLDKDRDLIMLHIISSYSKVLSQVMICLLKIIVLTKSAEITLVAISRISHGADVRSSNEDLSDSFNGAAIMMILAVMEERIDVSVLERQKVSRVMVLDRKSVV